MLADSADVVVIGGGVIGASCAYHLARHKLKVVLLEKGDPASGASGAAAAPFFCRPKAPART